MSKKRTPQSFEKRRREMAKKMKRQEKLDRKHGKSTGTLESPAPTVEPIAPPPRQEENP